ncbi:precorrin-6y C5,15-methyltransferase (decarboxylating) subunit CbiE [Desulforhopalus vacuolatus]|uniref:precorrin-6y C5,15-methyltransferase (decarboxylating) subunit CbiE n=1 Tax=Desulforhopalus vacuolatus TaxID=40414 RepID=UPI001966B714|nr:precorrin-6y C5,15-methyltransferase (decarboxylating) subunit CbiE [Desulforhopalus vacuolatus]MBM9520620.1 precorrin-6y C5,15-methyltransferase (decarboxylating) subunit CbiE [Desulforhopalus vacuolatus]
MEHNIIVIGIATLELSPGQQRLLEGCCAVFGTPRFKALAGNIEYYPITPLKEAITAIASARKLGNVAVFASGDPLFYGIGRTLMRNFPRQILQFAPSLSSIQRAAALFRLPWEDARLLSLHNRNCDHLPGLLLSHHKSILLTDSTNSPRHIATRLLDYLEKIDFIIEAAAWRVCIAEDIGSKKEKIFTGTLAECATQKFAPLNVFCLYREEAEPQTCPCAFGLTEEEIHHSRGLITKSEVRAATLHALRLPRHGIFWDVGAGSGAVSIEAARINPQLTVFAVEHKEEEIANIKANIRRFRCFNIVPVFGRAPQALAGLPTPNRIFVGGSSGALEDIVKTAAEFLPEDGRIVINGVLAKTVETAPLLLTTHSFTVESARLSVTRVDHAGKTTEFNPITITTGIK